MHLITSTVLIVFATWIQAQRTPNIPVENRTLDEIYQAAQAESGKLTILWGGDARDQAAPTVEAFTKRFPKILLNLTVGYSKYFDGAIDRSLYENNPYVDIAILQTLQDYPRWKAENRLLYYKPTNFSLIDDGEKDSDGAWLPLFALNFGNWVYDSTALNASDIPSTFADLLDPKWKGKLVSMYPTDDDAVLYLYSQIVSKYGFAWLTAFLVQDVLFFRGSQIVSTQLDPAARNASSSGRILTFTGFTFGTSPAVKSAPQIIEREIGWFQRGATLVSTARPEMAKLFMAWLQSDEFQRPLALAGSATQFPYLNKISGLDPHGMNNTQVDGFPRFMLDRAAVERWRFQFESAIGPPQGISPLLTDQS